MKHLVEPIDRQHYGVHSQNEPGAIWIEYRSAHFASHHPILRSHCDFSMVDHHTGCASHLSATLQCYHWRHQIDYCNRCIRTNSEYPIGAPVELQILRREFRHCYCRSLGGTFPNSCCQKEKKKKEEWKLDFFFIEWFFQISINWMIFLDHLNLKDSETATIPKHKKSWIFLKWTYKWIFLAQKENDNEMRFNRY